MSFTETNLCSYATADKAMDAISLYLQRYGVDLSLDAYDAIQSDLVTIIEKAEVIER